MSFIVKSSIGRKLVMSVSGMALILFLLFHMCMNFVAVIDDIAGTSGYNAICRFLGANWYAVAASMGLAFLVIVHFVYAFWLTIQNRKSRGNQKYAYSKKPASVKWASQNMFVLGLIVLGFLFLHLSQFWYKMQFAELAGIHGEINPQDGFAFIEYYFSNIVNVIAYVIWLTALWFHLTHGFWSAFQTIGLSGRIWYNRLRTIGVVLATFISGGFAIVPVYFYIVQLF